MNNINIPIWHTHMVQAMTVPWQCVSLPLGGLENSALQICVSTTLILVAAINNG